MSRFDSLFREMSSLEEELRLNVRNIRSVRKNLNRVREGDAEGFLFRRLNVRQKELESQFRLLKLKLHNLLLNNLERAPNLEKDESDSPSLREIRYRLRQRSSLPGQPSWGRFLNRVSHSFFQYDLNDDL